MEKDIDFFRQEYVRQKKLEKIVNARILQRPNVKKWQVATILAILPFLLAAIIFVSFTIDTVFFVKLICFLTSIIILLELYLRFCIILIVKYYQCVAKEETRRTCKCIPSCSEYALISLKRIFPLVRCLLKIRKRLYITCNGEEYKVDFPTKKMGEKFENQL